MKQKGLTHKEIRAKLREKGIPVVRTGFQARFKCRRRYRKDGNPQWAFLEEYGCVILDKVTVKAYNKGRMANNLKPLRVRDMDQMCYFRHPKKGWMYSKKKKS